MTNSKPMSGIFPPMMTPFKENGDLDQENLKNNIDFLVERGVHGLFITGSYGAFALLRENERKQVVEQTVKHVAGRIPVLAHVGASGTDIVIDLAKHAEANGVSGVSCVVPFYYSGFAYKDANIEDHFEALLKAVKIPVYLYNNPKTTGFRVSTTLLRKLAEMGVKGMKDSSGDALLFGDFINNVRPYHPDFNFMTGTTGMMVVSHAYGTSSTVAGTANVFPEVIVKLHNLLEAKEYDEAFALQMKVIRIRELQNVEGFRPAACYSMLKMRGFDFGTCRRPWRELTQESVNYVKQELKAINLL